MVDAEHSVLRLVQPPDVTVGTRVCRKCQQMYAVSDFGKGSNKNWCKSCLNERQHVWAATPEPGVVRVCTQCGLKKPIDQFNAVLKGLPRKQSMCRRCKYKRDAVLVQQHRDKYGRRASAKGSAFRRWFTNVRSRARRAGIPFDLALEDVFVPDFCPVLGIRLVWTGRAGAEDNPSLDRLVPQKGYVKGNVAVISRRANRIKNDGTRAEHERIVEWLRSLGVP